MINAGMEYDSRTYTPLYRLISGEPGHSHAIDIARRFGLPERVIVFAREMIGTAGAEFTSLLAELRRKRVELDDTARSLERQQERINDMQKEVEARSAGIAQARREASEKAWSEAREVISNTRRRMNELLDEYKREKRTETIEKIRKTEAELTTQLKPQLIDNDDLLSLKEVKPGDQVHVRSINNNAVVLQVDSKRGKARVRAGSMELDVLISDLASRRKADVKKQSQIPQRQWKVDTVESEQTELKLIGLRVEEALDMLEPFLNQASLSNIGEVRIIHGLGSGRLKQAVREYLTHHQLVENFRSGEPHEGRDGATVVKIRN
jgi:DNA mismatch repair protein MutS2